MDRFELWLLDLEHTPTQGRQWWFGQAPIDNADTGYIRDVLGRMGPEAAEWLVKFCRFVCTAVDEAKGESDANQA